MKIVAVTACPSGVAHTYLAAESLAIAAKKNNCEIKVETQGSIGIENELTSQEIADAKVVILTNDIGIKNVERFKGKPVVTVKTGDCLKKSDAIIKKLIEKLG
ncbi:MAG: PTS fructose-like transporter subunit IIB [Clostridiaceae bacterium]